MVIQSLQAAYAQADHIQESCLALLQATFRDPSYRVKSSATGYDLYLNVTRTEATGDGQPHQQHLLNVFILGTNTRWIILAPELEPLIADLAERCAAALPDITTLVISTKGTVARKPEVIPGVLIFFRRLNAQGEHEYLLHLRQHTGFHDGDYSVPGGHMDGNETYLDCTMRECTEEVANVTIQRDDLQPVHLIYRKRPEGERPDMGILIERWEGEPRNREADKHGEFQWVAVSQLPTNMVPYVRQAITCIEQGIFYSEFGWE